jgi:hypothetical protein
MSKLTHFQFEKDFSSAVEYLKVYIGSYGEDSNYQVETWIYDILYGLGVSIDSEKYIMADGFKKFKEDLIAFLRKDEE